MYFMREKLLGLKAEKNKLSLDPTVLPILLPNRRLLLAKKSFDLFTSTQAVFTIKELPIAVQSLEAVKSEPWDPQKAYFLGL